MNPEIEAGMTAQREKLGESVKGGDGLIGWKVGFGSPEGMAKLGISAPLVGFLTESSLLAPGSQLNLADYTRPVAEPEIALYLGQDVPAGSDPAAIKEAIFAIGPAIEIADLAFPPDDIVKILAGNIYQRHLILGPGDSGRAGTRLDGLTTRITKDEEEIAAAADIEAHTGSLIGIVRQVADTLDAVGDRLRAGQFIIAGSVVPPIFVEEPHTIGFALGPYAPITVTFGA